MLEKIREIFERLSSKEFYKAGAEKYRAILLADGPVRDQLVKHRDLLLAHARESPGLYLWLSVLLSLASLAGYSLLMSLIYSMELIELAHEIPWGLMVSNYVFWVGTSCGLCIIASFGLVFGIERYEPIARRALFMAIITIIFGMASIMLHLGHPERPPIYSALSPNPLSAMWWMGTAYPAYIVFLMATCWLLTRAGLAKTAVESIGLKAVVYHLLALGLANTSKEAAQRDLKWARVAGVLALASGLFAYSIEGTLFSHTEARPLWHGGDYSLYFLHASLLCGFSFLLVSEIITRKSRGESLPGEIRDLVFEMARILAALASVGLLLSACKTGYGLFESHASARAIILRLTGPFSVGFWVFDLLIGAILPIFILLGSVARKSINGVLLGAIMMAAGAYVRRYIFIVAAQVYPVLEEGLPSYMPGLLETLLVLGLIACILLFYTLGELFLPIGRSGFRGSGFKGSGFKGSGFKG